MKTITLNHCLSSLTLAAAIYSLPASADSTLNQQNSLFFSQTEAVLPEELENERGRGGFDITAINDLDVQATLTGNVANNNVTGANIIDHGSFAGAVGMFSIIQNTGNNVIIQDSTIVNVTIVP